VASSLIGKAIFGDVIVVQPLGSPHLYNLMRREFVKNNTSPGAAGGGKELLSPDGFSFFGRLDCQAHNGALRRATSRLRDELIPAFAEQLLRGEGGLTGFLICRNMRHRGINARYLGAVRAALMDCLTGGNSRTGPSPWAATSRERYVFVRLNVCRLIKCVTTTCTYVYKQRTTRVHVFEYKQSTTLVELQYWYHIF
jgi:hypothetical protein